MKLADSFRAARWVRLINLLLQAVLFLSLFGGLNYIAINHGWRYDLTQNRRHSLSPETTSYLERLESGVRILVTVTDDPDSPDVAQAYRDIAALLREYVYATRGNEPGRVEVEFLDIYRNGRRASELGVDQPNVVILVCRDKSRILTLSDFYNTRKTGGQQYTREAFRGESAVTAAILDVSSPEKKKIYFTTGHGERSPDSVDPARGLSQLRDELRFRNFALAGIELAATHQVPDDAALLIVAGPQRPFSRFEEELLRTYLQTRAGRVLLLLDPDTRHGLENLLFDWGVIVYDNLVYDANEDYQSETGDLILRNYLPHPITRKLLDNALPLRFGPTRVVSDDLGRSADDGLTVTKLVATSPSAWGETNYRFNREYTPGQDLRGQLGVLVISERVKPSGLPNSVQGGRLAVVGTSDFVTNNRLISGGNNDLFLNLVNWAVDRDTQLNIPARPIERFQLALSQDELARLRLGLLGIVPGAVALLGLLVYWTRRR